MAGAHKRKSGGVEKNKTENSKAAAAAAKSASSLKRKERNGEDEVVEFGSRILPAVSCFAFIFTALLGLVFLLWSFTRQSPVQPASGTANASVYERGLVTTDTSYQSVLFEHSRYWKNVSHRHFQSSVLAYVTPWNGKGYDMAKIFRSKLTHVSPVWYQLKKGNDGLNLHGRHDVDEQWIKDVRQEGSPLIVPRVVLEGWPLDLLVKKEECEKAVHIIADEIMEMQLDGIVLEAWSLWSGHRVLDDPHLRKKALEFVKLLGLELHTMKGSHLYSTGPPQLIFVIPPTRQQSDSSFTRSDMLYLRDAVDGFSLMTYDYSSPYSPGPNAPLKWIRKCLQLLLPGGPKPKLGSELKHSKRSLRDSEIAGKLLMGMNFYGNDYTVPQGGGPILGHEFVYHLARHKPQIAWEDANQEHRFDYTSEESKERRIVYYPSLQSLSVRLKEAEAWGVGISIWEIGQGLDYFYDLL